ncbi:MAG: TonB-dependent receptor [Cyclobacteriaceae bacterium]|nr:TonB-dependent receptor [Cyclobacteriaceae bacterium]
MRLLLLTFILLPFFGHAQTRFTLSGYVKDGANGEALIGANIYVRSLATGTTTNVYGFYSLTIEPGEYEIVFSYIGYSAQNKTLNLNESIRLDLELQPEGRQLEEVVVSSEKELQGVKSLQMSVNRLDINTILRIPAFLGEADVIKSLQQLPGVSTVGEGASGFNVRGGSVGQNLILLDEATVYNSSHLLGFFSVFNPDAVKDTRLYKGAVPAQYGGRIASLLDVRMKEGNNKTLAVNGGIGTIFSRASVEGPIANSQGSFIVAGRRSYADILARPFVDILNEGAALNFYDLTGKVNYNLNKQNRIFLSGYTGRDKFFFDKNQGFSWGNNTGTLRWNKIFNDRLFANFSTVFSKYDYSLQFGENERDNFRWKSSVQNLTFRPAFSYFINTNNEVSFGAEANYYWFEPANAYGTSNGSRIDISLPRKYNLETALYAGNNQKLSQRVAVEYGIRFSHFVGLGSGVQYDYNDTTAGTRRTPVAERTYSRNQRMATYQNLEPRLAFKAELNDVSSVKASYTRMAQYVHLISNTTASNPLDVWTPSTNNIKPETGNQYAVGWFRDFGKDRMYEFSAEAYYRSTQNQIDYIDGADLLINQYLEGDLLSGIGRAYGLELYLQKKSGRFTGWVAYTLARTELKVNGINNNQWYATRYDQTHNVKVSGFYDLNKRWSASANFTFVSGTPATFPTSRYVIQGILIPYNAEGGRNNVRLPAYHRLDIAFRLEGKTVKANGKARKNSDYWVFGVYNVYARKNPFSIYFTQGDERVAQGSPLNSEARQLAIIGTFIPSVSYNFKF